MGAPTASGAAGIGVVQTIEEVVMDGSGSTAESNQETTPAPGSTAEITAAEEAAADPELGDASGTVAAHYRQMTERGAHQKGEGSIP